MAQTKNLSNNCTRFSTIVRAHDKVEIYTNLTLAKHPWHNAINTQEKFLFWFLNLQSTLFEQNQDKTKEYTDNRICFGLLLPLFQNVITKFTSLLERYMHEENVDPRRNLNKLHPDFFSAIHVASYLLRKLT